MSIGRTLTCLAVAAVCLAVGMTAATGASQQKLPKEYTETITTEDGDKLSFEMVLIPKGTFLMGSPADEAGRDDHEGPQHKVCLDSFYLCTKETNIELFMAYYKETASAKRDFETGQQAIKDEEQSGTDGVDAITGPTPVYGDATMGYGENNPAIGMTWHNAATFCKWLSLKTGEKYRLPTEAEWEYACRAGTTNVFGVANDPGRLADFAWYKESADSETCEVGKKKPNAWGLYDMLGNVREWVHDFYSTEGYAEAAQKNPAVNPQGPATGKVHVARGGDYSSPPEELRCAARGFEEKWWRSGDPQIPKSMWWLPEIDVVGLRVARSIDADDQK